MTDAPKKKRIVLCSDGTGNTVIKGRGSNVWKTFESIDVNGHREAPDGEAPVQQVAFYDDGVGTESVKLLKILGGAFGWGLSRNVRQLYTMLCRVYEPGDDIFLFGFSRGAHTARTLGGLIGLCGVIDDSADESGRFTDPELKALVDEAYRHFRKHFRLSRDDIVNKTGKYQAAVKATDDFRNEHRNEHGHADPGLAPPALEGSGTDGEAERFVGVPIRFVGVWDTVAAVGLPFKEATTFWNRFVYPFRFPTYELGSLVQKGCHAISIDDQRETFHPDLWNESDEKDPDRIEQVWFAGVHSNVGGGYLKQGMSLIALDWMMGKAEEAGLRFIRSERDRYRALRNVNDKLYDSRSGLASYYRYKPRDLAEICAKSGVRPAIHSSVLDRIAAATDGYAPGNLPAAFDLVAPASEPQDPGSRVGVLRMLFAGEPGDEKQSMIGMHFREVSGWVRLRRRLHLCLILITVALVAIGVALFRSELTWATYAMGGVIVFALIVSWFVGAFARRKLTWTFAKWWRESLGL